MSKKLTAARVRSAPAGVYGDQFGLRLRVLPSGTRQWVWRGTVDGKRVDRGLGGYPVVTLAEARDMALECKRAARRGDDDPRTLRGGRSVPTLAEAADRVIALRADGWKDDRTEAQWRASLRDHAAPLMGTRVDRITAADVLGVVGPIWNDKRETAHRVRTRISSIMRWTIAEGHRVDDPAGEAIRAALPKNGNGEKLHHRAVGHADVADVLTTVRSSRAWWATRLAIIFTTLTATRSGEARQARWDEMDGATWAVPASRMKTNRPHRVPLSTQALAVLHEARRLGSGGGLVFPSARSTRPVAGALLRALLADLDTGTTLHGMRSAFRSWAADAGVDREVAEAALAHVVKGVEGAYQRSDLFERRREVMERWADYTTPQK